MRADPLYIEIGSPNHGPRKGGAVPRFVLLHYTAMESFAAARARLCDPEAEVSAHYLIGRQGQLVQLVAEQRRAWHAGAGGWGDCTDLNSASIGIELENPGSLADHPPFPDPQMRRLERLLCGIMARWGIPRDHVLGHSDIAPARKPDPGPKFDWTRLARQGLAARARVRGRDADSDAVWPLAQSLDALGYPPAPAEARLAAFRLRWRQGARGPESAADRALAAAQAAPYRFTLRWGGAIDAVALDDLICAAIHAEPSPLTKAQRQAWRAGPNPDRLAVKLAAQRVLIAEDALGPAGMLTRADGYIDLAFIHPRARGTGLFARLYGQIEADALRNRVDHLTVDASQLAEPAFAAEGFMVIRRDQVRRGTQILPRAHMEKRLFANGA